MATTGDILTIPQLGVEIRVLRTAADTGGELFEAEVTGRPRGFLVQEHVHPRQRERWEVLEGAMRIVIDGREHLLGPGDAVEVPAGAPHRHLVAGDGDGRARLQSRPALDSEAFLARLAELGRAGRLPFGYPTPAAALELVRDFAHVGHASRPPLRIQRALAGEYRFVDEWDVDAPVEAVFDTLVDARTYPEWWRPVYLSVDGDGDVVDHHFRGRLPYELRVRTTTLTRERPHRIETAVEGDLSGHGRWTLTPTARGTHVRFDWHVHADRPLLRALTPVLRPALRWNHAWAIARAREGLGPYARARTTAAAAPGAGTPGAGGER